MGTEKTVSFYDPTVDAYREIPISLAKKFVDGIEEVKQRIADAEVEQAKEDAYNKSLSKK